MILRVTIALFLETRHTYTRTHSNTPFKSVQGAPQSVLVHSCLFVVKSENDLIERFFVFYVISPKF